MRSSGVRRLLTCCCLLATALVAWGGTLVQFRTTLGVIVVDLHCQEKPITARNFVRYVDEGRYTNIFFHRCLPGFVVQGGGFLVQNPLSSATLTQVYSVISYAPITNEFDIGPRYSNVYGTIAMAKTAEGPDSATSQWFFNLGDNSANLDYQNGGFTVFGHVIKGTNVLELFNARYMSNGIVRLDGGNFSDVPVTYIGTNWPNYNELIYVNMELLKAEPRLSTNGVFDISWNSVEDMTNVVEYADPSDLDSWQVLCSTNGTGDRLTATDPNSGTNTRLYRIRIQ